MFAGKRAQIFYEEGKLESFVVGDTTLQNLWESIYGIALTIYFKDDTKIKSSLLPRGEVRA